MYEAEVNRAVEPPESLPTGIRERFVESRARVLARTLLPWGEHCTECNWPTCYHTCELYSPRQDGACRLFVGGSVRIDNKGGLNPYLLKIQFKRWGKLWTVGNLTLRPLAVADRTERLNLIAGTVGRNVPLPRPLKARVLQKLNYRRRRAAETGVTGQNLPDSFLLECFNPNSQIIVLTVSVRLRMIRTTMPFQTTITLSPGYNRAEIPLSDISARIDLAQPFEVEIVPNQCENAVLYFGLMDFVKVKPTAVREATASDPEVQVKCVVWDLDNTLWDGILIEDGPDKVRLRQEVVEVIRRLDERGILHSIASKNEPGDALQVLRAKGIDEYFLYPQIAWQPKSRSLAAIAQALNIGVEALAFVDDQEFERQEVKAALPQIRVIAAADFAAIPARPDCCVPVTAESRHRRTKYREAQLRQAAEESFAGDYLGFLRSCHLQMHIHALDDGNLKRVYELAQRTNQLNFSGNRYGEDQLRQIMTAPHLETFVVDCVDRFGQYGIVGFGVVDVRKRRLLDLMFSCRVQGKRVEHAVLAFLLKRFMSDGESDFLANYRKTAKNAPAGKVFDDMGFMPIGEEDGITALIFRRDHPIPDDQIVETTSQSYSVVSGIK